ncbi:MAG: hypothetical protein M3347_05320 [Armatimonadota bacterium]|nr:hypothetical protein [Armatimonadota bacterium]
MPLPRSYRAESLEKDEPPPIYSADANDPWNRIFYHLFTRSVTLIAAQQFSDAAPFAPLPPSNDVDSFMPLPPYPATNFSQRRLTRIESGDRTSEPLYMKVERILDEVDVLVEPRFSRLKQALDEALAETRQRSPLQRAVMQSDAWAAYDILFGLNYYGGPGPGETRREEARRVYLARYRLLSRLARLVGKLALTPAEIQALPDNYALAAKRYPLPPLFAPESGWLETEWSRGRVHERLFHGRKAARIFLKPSASAGETLQDKVTFLENLGRPQRDRTFAERLNQAGGRARLFDAAAVVVQLLLIDTTGQITPAPLTVEVSIRRFIKDDTGRIKPEATRYEHYQLSRKRLVSQPAEEPTESGLVPVDEQQPAYLPWGINDLGFVGFFKPEGRAARTPTGAPGRRSTAVLVPLRLRCQSCHGRGQWEDLEIFRFFGEHSLTPEARFPHPAKNEHGRYLAQEKRRSAEFRILWMLAQGREPDPYLRAPLMLPATIPPEETDKTR